MKEVFALPDASDHWRRAAEGEAVDWEVVFAGYRATVDWPGAYFYRQLAARYPAAKVILSVRDAESWFRSTQATIFADSTFAGAPPAWRAMVQKVIVEPMGGRLDDRETLIARFHAHNEEVQRVIPRERLLVFQAAEGWKPLCAFLGLPEPSEPYPRTNTTEDWIERTRGQS
jgi:hypothetical protein